MVDETKNIGFSLQDTLNPIIFAPMEIDLEINSVNDYANDIGAPTYHPHVSVIHYDEVGEIRHTINLFNVYGIFLQKNFPDNKFFVTVPGATHTDLYDGGGHNFIPFDKLTDFFNKYLR